MTSSRIIANIAHDTDMRLSLPAFGLEVEVQTYHQPEPYEGVFSASQDTLSMALTPEVRFSRCSILEAAGTPAPWVPVGDIMFIPAGTRLRVVAPGGTAQFRGLYCFFAPHLFARVTGLQRPWTDAQLAAGLDVKVPQIKRDLYRILREISEHAPGHETVAAATAEIVLVEIARYLRRAGSSVGALPPTLATWQMRRLTNYVEGMVDHFPAIDELARLCDLSPRHLARAYKAATGRTLGTYIAEVRLTKAKSLLSGTDLPLKEIAHRLGFAGPSSFSVAFAKAEGVTPGEFRAGYKYQ